jgi:hypothetical protein
MCSGVTKSHFRKAKALEKGHQSESSIMKMLGELKESQMVGSKDTTKSTTGLIKVIFENSLMQRH